jgi:hypothetical protein
MVPTSHRNAPPLLGNGPVDWTHAAAAGVRRLWQSNEQKDEKDRSTVLRHAPNNLSLVSKPWK